VGSQADLSATPSTRIELATPGLGNLLSDGVEYGLPGLSESIAMRGRARLALGASFQSVGHRTAE
jgi:hypothetical protein